MSSDFDVPIPGSIPSIDDFDDLYPTIASIKTSGRRGEIWMRLDLNAHELSPASFSGEKEISIRVFQLLQIKFLRDHLFHVENCLRASECRFSLVRHGLQWTVPIAEAFQAVRIRK